MANTAVEPRLLKRVPFDCQKILGDGYKIIEQLGRRSSDLDAARIVVRSYLVDNETAISGKERLFRIKAANSSRWGLIDPVREYIKFCYLYKTFIFEQTYLFTRKMIQYSLTGLTKYYKSDKMMRWSNYSYFFTLTIRTFKT
jgi:hypothetical protein